MGRPPAFVFVVRYAATEYCLCIVHSWLTICRHGNRLDVADKKWHLTSPTPYDPPLTYGGWLQSKALGAKIASILSQSETEFAPESATSAAQQTKRYNIIVHSSPFLRCVQTSIAISAGLAQAPNAYPASPASVGMAPNPSHSPPTLSMPSPALRPTVTTAHLQPLKESNGKTLNIQKTLLRLDSFLGEWLCPEYFELITPPPSSTLMLAGAKAELLRREDYASYPHFAARQHSNSGSTKLWNSPLSSPADRLGPVDSDVDISVGLENMPPLSDLPDQDDSPGRRKDSGPKVRFLPGPTSTPTPAGNAAGYVAPTPHYALSSSGKIPEGYVAHAKDACVTVDYQWDSMREPLEWGDGGSYGEEWAAMHRRFRKGIQNLVDWYATTETPAQVTGRTSRPSSSIDPDLMADEDDSDVENVVIIVSHGAGCNAIIGAITHQPVLMEVGMASLTMAVRKPGNDGEYAPSSLMADEASDTASVASSKEAVPVHQYYDLKIFANMEHIRSNSNTPATVSRHNSRADIHHSASRGRMPTFGTSPTSNPFIYTDSFNRGESRSNSANASLGSIRRSTNNTSFSLPRAATSGSGGFGSHVQHQPNPIQTGLSRSPSIGLWSPATSRLNVSQEADEDDDDIFPDFDHKKKFAPVRKNTKDSVTSAEPSTPDKSEDKFSTSVEPIQIPATATTAAAAAAAAPRDPASSMSQSHGSGKLWGSPRTGEAPPVRDLGTAKRRWTVNERA